MVLGWDGVEGEKDLIAEAVQHWATNTPLSFVDAYLAALARRLSCPVYRKNVRDLLGEGVAIPDTLPGS